MEVLGDQRPDVFVDDLRLPAFGVDDEPRPVVDPVDDTHRRLEDGVRVRGDRDHWAERHRRMWFREVGALDVLDVAKCHLDGPRRRRRPDRRDVGTSSSQRISMRPL